MDNYLQRKQLRIRDYNYSQVGYYFVTICTKEKLYLFGEIVEEDDPVCPPQMHPSTIGNIVCECWYKINDLYDNVKTDVFCLMPNHIHGVIVIDEAVINNRMEQNHSGQSPGGQGRPPLPKIIQGFKSVTTRLCFKHGHRNIWQRGYYEHIIRNDHELQEISEYIINNPAKWREDKYFV